MGSCAKHSPESRRRLGKPDSKLLFWGKAGPQALPSFKVSPTSHSLYILCKGCIK